MLKKEIAALYFTAFFNIVLEWYLYSWISLLTRWPNLSSWTLNNKGLVTHTNCEVFTIIFSDIKISYSIGGI